MRVTDLIKPKDLIQTLHSLVNADAKITIDTRQLRQGDIFLAGQMQPQVFKADTLAAEIFVIKLDGKIFGLKSALQRDIVRVFHVYGQWS